MLIDSLNLLPIFLADNDTYGSEDSINGKYFPMELHIVFFKSSYKTQENAIKHSDGLVVLAFFFIISQKPNTAYVEVSQSLKKIIKAHTSTSLEYPLSLWDYINEDIDDFFVYNGSLTTPPCLDKYPLIYFYTFSLTFFGSTFFMNISTFYHFIFLFFSTSCHVDRNKFAY